MFTLATNRQKKVFCCVSISFFRYYHQKTKKKLLHCGGLCLADRNTAQVILKMDFRHYVAFKMYEGGGVGRGRHRELLFSFLLKRRKGKWAKSIWRRKKKKKGKSVWRHCVFPSIKTTTITYHAPAAKCWRSHVAPVKIHSCISTGVIVHSLKRSENTHTHTSKEEEEEGTLGDGSGH